MDRVLQTWPVQLDLDVWCQLRSDAELQCNAISSRARDSSVV